MMMKKWAILGIGCVLTLVIGVGCSSKPDQTSESRQSPVEDVNDTASPLVDKHIPDRPTKKDQPYSFSRPPYIHPKIVEDLSSWLSDSGDQVVGINLADSQDSNRYFGDILIRKLPHSRPPFVYVEENHSKDKPAPFFGYNYIGTTESGVHVLRTLLDGGGSGVFVSLMFLSIHREMGISYAWDNGTTSAETERFVLRKLGQVGLGDRWNGKLRVEGNKVYIGKDKGLFANTQTTNEDRFLSIIVNSQHGAARDADKRRKP